MGLTADQLSMGDGILKVCILVECIVFCALYFRSYCLMRAQLSDGIRLYLRVVMIPSLVFVSTYTIRYFFSTIGHYIEDKSDGYQAFEDIVKMALFVIGHTLFYTLMILRLYFVFKQSPYALSKTITVFLAASLTVITIVDIAYFSIQTRGAVFFFTLVLLDIVFGIALIAIFTHKLTQMGVDSRERAASEYPSQASNAPTQTMKSQGGAPAPAIEMDEGSDSDDMYKDHGSGAGAGAQSTSPRQHNMRYVQSDATVPTEQQQMSPRSVNSANGNQFEADDGRAGKSVSSQLSATQVFLVSAAAKYALLCGLTILFINLQFLCQAINDFAGASNEFVLVLEIWYFWVLFVEFFTIYLSFPNTAGQYDKSCGALHKMFEGLFRVNMMTELQKKEAEERNELRQVCCCKLKRDIDRTDVY
mmetsp:Transcript_10591/g.17084  ORF Transcript_10591/g.17084 Transcript_10591/m.17084 type:complete len:418 (-) Transcript_10591:116-1369(-)